MNTKEEATLESVPKNASKGVVKTNLLYIFSSGVVAVMVVHIKLCC